MRRLLALLLGIAAFGPPAAARAQTCAVTPLVRSYSTADAGPHMASGPFSGHPAATDASSGVAQPGANYSVRGALAIDQSYFALAGRAGGEMLITGQTSNSGLARSIGDVYDCLQIDGYGGTGRLHVPVHLNGRAAVEFSTSAGYEGTAGASASFVVACEAYVGSGPLLSCPVTNFAFGADQAIDTVVDLSFPFTFGTPTSFHFGPRLDTALGYAANGSEGTLAGFANVELVGALEAATVEDGFGTALPNATITAASGFDYRHPAPEPHPIAAAAVAAAALAWRRRAARDAVRPSR